ncbi:MAG: WbqC family protein [Tannerella sp.]|jgi:hypothetical protein|nr:WbqC family protein [Tannerella sp.]
MTKVVIHQPYFIPWMGYFSKLVYADKFIVLDNVKYSARHYLDRTQIINSQGNLMWIKLPIGEPIHKKIDEIYFSNANVVKKIIQNLHSSYSKARFFKNNIPHIESILTDSFNESDLLSEINISIGIKIMELLTLNVPQIIRSSQFEAVDDATDRIIMLCKENQCDTIIGGSVNGIEIHNIQKLTNNNIAFLLQDYFNNHPVYYQTRRTQLGFAKGLSIVDSLFNEGAEKTKLLLYDKKNIPIQYKTF